MNLFDSFVPTMPPIQRAVLSQPARKLLLSHIGKSGLTHKELATRLRLERPEFRRCLYSKGYGFILCDLRTLSRYIGTDHRQYEYQIKAFEVNWDFV